MPEPGWLPIREVARQTGVNPVTLRAWERRYGLILPRRTPKGHRLYNEAHVARIHAVLAWLNRGVAVGQVRDLLDREPPSEAEAAPDSPWQVLQGNCSPPPRRWPAAVSIACSTRPARSTRHPCSARACSSRCSPSWSGANGPAPGWSARSSCPGYAAGSVPGYSSTTARAAARRCCWPDSAGRRSSPVCGSAPGSPRRPAARWKCSTAPYPLPNWNWRCHASRRAPCCSMPPSR
ncbi:MerR family transcriptional regulator [Azotobacter chroococcum]